MDLTVTSRERDGRTIVSVGGEVDVYSAQELREHLVEPTVEGGPAPHVIVDLSNVHFMDSTGLGVLVGALKRTREAGGTLELVADDERILRVFRITGLTDVFTIHPTLDAAC